MCITTCMDNKQCSKCSLIKPLTEFRKQSSSSDGHQTQCKTCHRELEKNHYRSSDKRRTSVRNRATAATNRNHDYVLGVLNESRCVGCGESDSMVLTFDHRYGQKLFNICDGVRNGVSLSNLQKEIAKCEVLCANCHIRKSARELGWKRYRAFSSID